MYLLRLVFCFYTVWLFPLSVLCHCIFHFPQIFVISSGLDQVWVFLVTPQVYLRYYLHHRLVVVAGTAVDSVGKFGTYNDGILVAMGFVIVVATVVIAAVVAIVVGVN